MKRIILFLTFFVAFSNIFPQTIDTLWTRAYGGSGYELFGTFATVSMYHGRWADIAIDENKRICIATTSQSSNYYVNQNNGYEDIWVIGLSSNGDTLWTKIYGGSSYERVLRVKAVNGGGWLIVGASSSSNGSFSSNHSTSGTYDGFIIRLDSQGNELWRKMYGGSSDDYLYDVIETSDGYYMACGEAYSSDGDLAGTIDAMNWVIKINKQNGNIVWSKTYYGADSPSLDRLENLFRITETTDNKIVMTGYTTPDYNNINLDRINIIKIDLSGNVLWTKKIGAPGGGDYPAAILPAENGGFYILAKLFGTVGGGGDASNYYGGSGDFWLVKLDASGNILFNKNYGGTNLDVPYDMKYSSDGNLYLSGLTRSTDLDATSGAIGGTDFWLLKVNTSGDTLYTRRYGGSSNDFCSGIAITASGDTIYLVGGTDSNDGMVHGFKGLRDLWIVKTVQSTTSYSSKVASNTVKIFPNPTKAIVEISCQGSLPSTIKICTLTGQTILQREFTNRLDISHIQSGFYLLQLIDKSGYILKTEPILIEK